MIKDRRVEIDYTNWRGERRKRVVVPQDLWFGVTEWHPKPQWILDAIDLEDGQMKSFGTKDIHGPWVPASEPAGGA